MLPCHNVIWMELATLAGQRNKPRENDTAEVVAAAVVVVDFSDTVSENTSKKDANGFPKERSPILLLLSDYLL